MLFAIFSRLRRVVTRWIIASYNIAFSKLPLKTEVFRGSLKSKRIETVFIVRIPKHERRRRYGIRAESEAQAAEKAV